MRALRLAASALVVGAALSLTLGAAWIDGQSISAADEEDPYLDDPSVSYSFIPAGVVITGSYVGEVADGAYTDLGEYTEGFLPLEPRCDWPAPDGDQPVCTFDSLSPGWWTVRSRQTSSTDESSTDESYSHGAYDDFYIPAAPTFAAQVTTAHRVRFTGIGESGGDIQVEFLDHRVACVADVVSEAEADQGTWSCSTDPLPPGSYTFRALESDPALCDCSYLPGGTSAYSLPHTVTVAAPAPTSTPTPTSTPAPPPPSPFDWSFEITGFDPANAHPGDQFTATGSGLPPGSTISGEIHSRIVAVGSTDVGSDGGFSMPVTVPDLAAGEHEIVLTMTGAGFAASPSSQSFTVAEDAVTAPTVPTGVSETGEHGSEGEGTAGESEGHGAEAGAHDSPNVLTHGLTTLADVVAHPAKISAALAIGLVLLVFAVLPAHLLNATIAEQYERFRRRAPRLLSVPPWFTALMVRLYRTPGVAGLALTSVTAVLFA